MPTNIERITRYSAARRLTIKTRDYLDRPVLLTEVYSTLSQAKTARRARKVMRLMAAMPHEALLPLK